MNNQTLLKIIMATLMLWGLAAYSDNTTDGHVHANGEHADNHDRPADRQTEIAPFMALENDIVTAQSSSQTLTQTIATYGRLITAPEQISHVRARFAGVITTVTSNIGDRVQQGDLLAQVESNESLKTYNIYAPISGVVTQRHANAGESTVDQILFSIARFDTLWAELKIFPNQRRQVQADQKVTVLFEDQRFPSSISHLIPDSNGQPYLIARAEIDNRKGLLLPGLIVGGQIIVDQVQVAVAIENAALQTLENKPGVFIKDNQTYHFAPLTLGRVDAHYSEVVSGIKLGETYVVKNAYLLKADIEKAGAEHQH